MGSKRIGAGLDRAGGVVRPGRFEGSGGNGSVAFEVSIQRKRQDRGSSVGSYG